MFYYNVKLTLLALAFIPGYVILTLVVTPIFKRQFREAFEKEAEADSQMVESVTGVGTVKATAAERRIRWKLEGLIVKSLNVQFRSALTGMANHLHRQYAANAQYAVSLLVRRASGHRR